MSPAPIDVILTGFPANQLARAVLGALLARWPSQRVACIVPAKLRARAEAWLLESVPAARERVDLLEGDAAHMDFGLRGEDFCRLAAQVRVVHHCASIDYLAAPRGVAETVNVRGTAEVLELARAATRLERIVHWSSTSATGPDEGVVYEHDLEEPSGGEPAHSRFLAEKIMRGAQRSLPVTILRPTPLVGDSVTGEVDRLDGPYLLISTMLSAPRDVSLPLPGRADAPLHMVPVDYAARAGVALGTLSETEGRTLHIGDPRPPALEDITRHFAELTHRPPPRRHSRGRLARSLLAVPGVRKLAPSHGAFVAELGRLVRYDMAESRGLLEPLGLCCPSAFDYAEQMVRAVEAKRAAAGMRRGERAGAAPPDSLTSQPASSS